MLDKRTSLGLKKLFHSCTSAVRLQLFIPLSRDENGGTSDARIPGQVPLSIKIYGPRSLFEQVGRLLSDHGLFLQRPENNEHGISYENPHYFVPRTGLTHAITAEGGTLNSKARRLHQIEDEVWAIFETTEIDFSNIKVDPGSGIKTSLKEFVQSNPIISDRQEIDRRLDTRGKRCTLCSNASPRTPPANSISSSLRGNLPISTVLYL